MTGISTYFSIITEYLWSQFLIKKHRLADWIKKQEQLFVAFKKIHLTSKDKQHSSDRI
jgi:hypothetical protein